MFVRHAISVPTYCSIPFCTMPHDIIANLPLFRRLDHTLFGRNASWFHVTNVLLHTVACALFTRVCATVAGLRRNFATLAGVLFAVHPIHTEAVSFGLLCLMFGISTGVFCCCWFARNFLEELELILDVKY